jgi:hypothetical protein
MSVDFPTVWLELNGMLICSFYREWTGPQQAAKLDIFLSQIVSASSLKRSLLVMGDCNLDQDRWDKSNYAHLKLANQLKTGLAQGGLQILPMGITYVANHMSRNGKIASSALDHIYYSSNKSIKTKVLEESASDHYPIIAEVDLENKASRKETTVTKRCFKSFDSEAFKKDIILQDLASIARCKNVDDMVTTLEQMISSVLDSHAPYKLVKMRAAFKGGLSHEAIDLMKRRNSLHRKMKKLSGDQKYQMHLQYRLLRNKCVTLQRRDTIKNNVTKFSGLTNTTDIWRAAKSIISPRTKTELKLKVGSDVIQDESTVAEVFNDYFVTKVEDLRRKIDATNLPDPLSKAKPGSHSQFILKTVSEHQVLEAINRLKNKASTGLDQVNSRVLKAGGSVLVLPLWFIINSSISSGKFPKRWKQSKLVPLHKKGDTHEVENYRPVSNLCVISKVMEMVVHDQISKHCQKEGIIPTSQHGFQKGKSTLTATISMFDQGTKFRGDAV